MSHDAQNHQDSQDHFPATSQHHHRDDSQPKHEGHTASEETHYRHKPVAVTVERSAAHRVHETHGGPASRARMTNTRGTRRRE